MKTFFDWIRAMVRPSRTTENRINRINFANLMADMYNGTDDCAVAGMWMTFADKERRKMEDET